MEEKLKFIGKERKQESEFQEKAWFLRLGGSFTGDGLSYTKNESIVYRSRHSSFEGE